MSPVDPIVIVGGGAGGLELATRLGDKLGKPGRAEVVLVDAQRAPLADAMIDAIRVKTAELQARMNEAGIAPGSTRALRLFS